jgi:hypothetical protein
MCSKNKKILIHSTSYESYHNTCHLGVAQNKKYFFRPTLSSFKHLQHVSLIITATCSKCPGRLHTCCYLCHLMCPQLISNTNGGFIYDLLVTYTLLLVYHWCTVIHMPHKTNLMGSSQVPMWAKPPLHLLISNFLCDSVEKFHYLCAETYRCTTMLQEVHSLNIAIIHCAKSSHVPQ